MLLTGEAAKEKFANTHTSVPSAAGLVTQVSNAPSNLGTQVMGPTPIKKDTLIKWANRYKRVNPLVAKELIDGFCHGFRIPSTASPPAKPPRNLKSIFEHPEAVRKKVEAELQLGRFAGPFFAPPLPNFICSPLGVVPKKDPGSFRLIHHLSHPHGLSVNDGIDRELCKVSYASFDYAISLVQKVGPTAYLAKADIKSAFRLLPIHPSDFHLLGFKFEGGFYYDRCLPMGCSISCSLFEKFSTFLEFCVKFCCNGENMLVTHYLDDFLFVGNDYHSCYKLLATFQCICKELGVPLANEKTVGPLRTLSFLGLEINASLGLVRVPEDKVLALREAVSAALLLKKISLKQLQSIIGSLNFVCKAVAPGRCFLRRLIDLTMGVKLPHHLVRIGQGARADLLAWSNFLSNFNGITLFLDPNWVTSPDFELYTDAALSIGYGAYFNGKWLNGRWPLPFKEKSPSIAAGELFPIVVAVKTWCANLANKRVLFWSDNQAVVSIINRQTSKCPVCMKLLRVFVSLCLQYNILFKAKYVPGLNNNIADALSRFQMSAFRDLAPHADLQMTPLPTLEGLI